MKLKIVFTGDLGQPDQPIIKDPTHIKEADYLVIESTYGDRKHQIYDKETPLAEIINDTMDRGGNFNYSIICSWSYTNNVILSIQIMESQSHRGLFSCSG